MPIMIITSPRSIKLTDQEEEIVKKGLRMFILVAEGEDGVTAAKILSILAEKT
jgi:hypothetical protein